MVELTELYTRIPDAKSMKFLNGCLPLELFVTKSTRVTKIRYVDDTIHTDLEELIDAKGLRRCEFTFCLLLMSSF